VISRGARRWQGPVVRQWCVDHAGRWRRAGQDQWVDAVSRDAQAVAPIFSIREEEHRVRAALFASDDLESARCGSLRVHVSSAADTAAGSALAGTALQLANAGRAGARAVNPTTPTTAHGGRRALTALAASARPRAGLMPPRDDWPGGYRSSPSTKRNDARPREIQLATVPSGTDNIRPISACV